MKKKRFLITGSNGLVGQALVSALRRRPDIECLATSRGPNRISSETACAFESLDVTEPGQIASVMEDFQPEVMIHTAAMTQVDACETLKDACWKLNVEAVADLIGHAEACGSHVIHLSTDFVFDGKAGPYREQDLPSPVNYYGQSKLASEKLFLQSRISWTILRTMLLYGTAERMRHSNFVLWAKASLEQGKSIRVVDDQFRAPTYAGDVAEACLQAALRGATGMYHISGSETKSIFEWVRDVAEFFRLDASLIRRAASDDLGQAARRPARTGFVLTKAARDLDYCPRTFRAGLEALRAEF